MTSFLPKVKVIYMKPLLWLYLEGSSTCSARSLSEQSASWWVQTPEGHVPSPSIAVIFHIFLRCVSLLQSLHTQVAHAWHQQGHSRQGPSGHRALPPPPPRLASITSFPWRGQGTGHRGFPPCLHSAYISTLERESASLDPVENKGSLLCFSLSDSLLQSPGAQGCCGRHCWP